MHDIFCQYVSTSVCFCFFFPFQFSRKISIVEQIHGMAGLMVRIPVSGNLSVNQRDRVLEPASTQTDPTPGDTSKLLLLLLGLKLKIKYVVYYLSFQFSFVGKGIQKTILDQTVVPMMNTMQTIIRDNMMPMEVRTLYAQNCYLKG